MHIEDNCSFDVGYEIDKEGISVNIDNLTNFKIPASCINHLFELNNGEFARLQEDYLSAMDYNKVLKARLEEAEYEIQELKAQVLDCNMMGAKGE